MAIDYRATYTEEQYVNAVVELIAAVESYEDKVYKLNDNMATIGYGYTFNRNNNVALWNAAGITLTPSQLQVLQQIDSATTDKEKTSIAYDQFRPIMTITKDQAEALLRKTYPEYEGPAANDLKMDFSPERVAFVAITYNRGVGNVRTKMQAFYQAVNDGDRAEAWFQIRYNSLGLIDEYVNGKAKARYLESQLFGLYKNSSDVSPDEAKKIYRMFQKHRKEIYDYENKYGARFDGTNGTRNMVKQGNVDYASIIAYFGLGRIDTIIESLNPSKGALFTYLKERTDLPELLKNNLTDYKIASTNIYVAPDPNQSSTLDSSKYETGAYINGANDLMIGSDQTDTIYGNKGDDVLIGENGNDALYGGSKKDDGLYDGNDVLYGGIGNDTLDGGTGIDIMIGGVGDDTYKVDNSADVIEEKDGEGKELVESTATYTLSDYVEDLTLMGEDNIDGTGNDLDNVIKGNTGNNKLDGSEKELLFSLDKSFASCIIKPTIPTKLSLYLHGVMDGGSNISARKYPI